MSEVFPIQALTTYLSVGAVLFALGILGFLARRNLIVMFLSIEMMLQGTAVTLVAFGRYHGNWTGQVFTIVILTVAACEAAVALALVLVLYNRRSSLDATHWKEIREPDLEPLLDELSQEAEPAEAAPGPETYPKLTPAGVEPRRRELPLERRR
jgi:NADH-quinone oxidoreductase subunit K